MTDSEKAKTLLYITLGLIFFRFSYLFFVGFTGILIRLVPTIIFVSSFFTAMLAARFYDHSSGGIGIYRMRRYIAIYGVTLIILFVRGFMNDHLLRQLLDEAFMFSYILIFMILGQYDEMWDDLDKVLWVPCLAMAVLCVVALRYDAFSVMPNYSSEYANVDGERWAVKTLGYQNIEALGLWPIVFALGFLKKRISISTFAALLIFLIFMFLQVWFQKRAPSIRGIAYFLSLLLILRKTEARTLVMLLPLLFLSVPLVFYKLAQSENFLLLLERFHSDVDISELGGRKYEILEMFAGFDIWDYLVGRGIGGYFLIDNWSAGIQEVSKSGILGRAYMHIGIFLPLLKGGVIFIIIYYWFALRLFMPKSRVWKMNRYNLVALAVLPVYMLFLFAEGPPSMSNLLDGVMYGLLCGRLVNLRQPLVQIERLMARPAEKTRLSRE